MWRYCLLGSLLVFTLYLVACVGDSPVGTNPAGTEGGPCFTNGTCNAGLTCLSGTCRSTVGDSGPPDSGSDALVTDAGTSDSADATPPNCEAGTTVCGVTCVDTTSDDQNCGACSHSCLGGKCSTSTCQPVQLAWGQTWVGYYGEQLAVDSTDVYYTLERSNVDGGAPAVRRVPKGGGAPVDLYSAPYGATVLLMYSGDIYFSSYKTGLIRCTKPNCGSPTVWMSGTGTPIPSGGYGSSLVTDGTNLWWNYPGSVSAATIQTMPIGGSTSAAYIGTTQLAQTLVTDGTNLWWNYGGSIYECAAGTWCSGATNPVTNGHNPTSLAVDATNLYFKQGSGLVKCDKTNCNNTNATTLTASIADAAPIVSDGTNVYWTDYAAGTVLECSIASGCVTPKTLAVSQTNPWYLAVDSTAVYWINEGTGAADGQVMKVAK